MKTKEEFKLGYTKYEVMELYDRYIDSRCAFESIVNFIETYLIGRNLDCRTRITPNEMIDLFREEIARTREKYLDKYNDKEVSKWLV